MTSHDPFATAKSTTIIGALTSGASIQLLRDIWT